MGILTSATKSLAFQDAKTRQKQSRFINPAQHSYQSKNTSSFCLDIKAFRKLQDWELVLNCSIQYKFEIKGNIVVRETFFSDALELDIYLGNLVNLKQLLKQQIYDQVDIKNDKLPSVVISKTLADVPKQLNKEDLLSNIPYFINLLVYISNLIKNVNHLFVIPTDIVTLNGQFHLTTFSYKKYEKPKLILGFISWLYNREHQQFDDCIREQISFLKYSQIDIYLKEIILSLKSDAISERELPLYLISVNKKIAYLGKHLQSLHACSKAKKQKFNVIDKKDWLLGKKGNEIYFVNINDQHVCQGRIIRKKRKVNIDNCMICFVPEEFQVFFFLEGTKNIVKTSEFQLSDCFTISDIQIKSKFPFKIKNPLIFYKEGNIYIFDQILYRYDTKINKIFQESKKINDCLCLVPSHEFTYLLVRISIDIFKHGIRIYMKDKMHDILLPSGDQAISQDLQNIRFHIKQVEFCIQIYRGIYLMLANKNLWILDLNFMCFFSFAPFHKLKEHLKSKSNLDERQFIFQILNQQFNFSWLSHQHGINVHIKDQNLHIIGSLMGKLYYLKYKIIFQSGQLKLISYHPLYSQLTDSIKDPSEDSQKEHTFNVYNQNLQLYKNGIWTYQGHIFLEVKDIKIATCKNYSQFSVFTEDTLNNLKELIDQYKQNKWNYYQTNLILYQIFTLFQYINQKNISHKNFNIGNIWVTKKKVIKLTGWSEAQKNWYISDYRDFLLVFFNVITHSTYQKFTDKNYSKHTQELSYYPVIKEKIENVIRNKKLEKKGEFQKQIIEIKYSLHSCIYDQVSKYKGKAFIFNFQQNTPRFSMLNILSCKIKKMIAIFQGSTHNEQFTFQTTDNYAWNEQESILFIMTASYQMYELKINCSDCKEETLVLEEYEYLPNNIIQFNFIYTSKGLFAFGGIARNSKKKIQYNKHVFHFNRQKLTWESVAEFSQPKMKPKLTISQTGDYIYIIGGDLDQGCDYFSLHKFHIQSRTLTKQVDIGLLNPIREISQKSVFYIINISQKYNIFMIWALNSTSYSCFLFSNMINGFEITFDGKIYIEDNIDLSTISMSMYEGSIHFLRSYGNYSKIITEGFNNPKLINKTLYANEK